MHQMAWVVDALEPSPKSQKAEPTDTFINSEVWVLDVEDC